MIDGSIRRVRRTTPQWGRATFACAIAAATALLALEATWPGGPTTAFLAVVAVVVALESAVFVRTTDRTNPQPLTLATWVTLSRGGAVAVLAGFVLVPSPPAAAAWVPATLFALAAGLDAVDGFVARSTDSTTALGARLDVAMDGLVVLVGSLVAVAGGAAPLAFLAVGAARYLFVLGTWWRERRGRPVLELPPNWFRRPLGALAMVAVWIALLPIPGPTVSYTVATVVMVPFLVNFYWDWLAVTGRVGDSGTT